MKQILHLVAGARPNFMKVAPLYHALSRESDWAEPLVIHTGQHYDHAMSDSFFADLYLPPPHVNFGVGSGSHAEQTGRVMVAYERFCLDHRPDWVIVVGDVNSTLACSIVAKKLELPLAHLEAGIRSRDRTMPEELNRVVADAIADLHWTPTEEASENLLREGIDTARVEHVGNIMIDSIELLREKIESVSLARELRLGAEFGVVTLHRPANVDPPDVLSRIVDELAAAAQRLPLVFAVHPRTEARLKEHALAERLKEARGIRLTPPLDYIRFLSLVREARVVVTDSGSIQGETSYLGIPCLTVRTTTEWPITLSRGTNRLIAPHQLMEAVEAVLAAPPPSPASFPLWDGRTAERVVRSLRRACGASTSLRDAAP
jgi:UDP-N-acetylglucosamine 2-epimerase (non-hydrolysing)